MVRPDGPGRPAIGVAGRGVAGEGRAVRRARRRGRAGRAPAGGWDVARRGAASVVGRTRRDRTVRVRRRPVTSEMHARGRRDGAPTGGRGGSGCRARLRPPHMTSRAGRCRQAVVGGSMQRSPSPCAGPTVGAGTALLALRRSGHDPASGPPSSQGTGEQPLPVVQPKNLEQNTSEGPTDRRLSKRLTLRVKKRHDSQNYLKVALRRRT